MLNSKSHCHPKFNFALFEGATSRNHQAFSYSFHKLRCQENTLIHYPNHTCSDRKGTINKMNFFQVELYAVNIFISSARPPDEAVPITQSKLLLLSQHFVTYFPFQFISSYLNSNELLSATQWLLQGMLAVQLCYFMQRPSTLSHKVISLDEHVKGKSNIRENWK